MDKQLVLYQPTKGEANVKKIKMTNRVKVVYNKGTELAKRGLRKVKKQVQKQKLQYISKTDVNKLQQKYIAKLKEIKKAKAELEKLLHAKQKKMQSKSNKKRDQLSKNIKNINSRISKVN